MADLKQPIREYLRDRFYDRLMDTIGADHGDPLAVCGDAADFALREIALWAAANAEVVAKAHVKDLFPSGIAVAKGPVFLGLRPGDEILGWRLENMFVGPEGCTYVFERSRERQKWLAKKEDALELQAYHLAYAICSWTAPLVTAGGHFADLGGTREDFVRVVERAILKSLKLDDAP